MSEGYEIPIGVDLSELHAAQEKMGAAFQQVSARISGSFEKSNAAIATSSARMVNLASTAGNVGNAVTGAASAVTLLSKASRALTGVNLAQHLTSLVTKAGGIRAAFAKIPAAMSAIASNPTLRKLVIGAAGAAAAILAIRTAWRTAAAATRLLRNAASSAFAAVVSGAARAAAAVRGVMGGLASLPGKILGGLPGIGAGLAGLAGAGGALALVMKSIGASSDMEGLITQFGVLTGSSEKAKDMIAALRKEAASSPLTVDDFAKAARTLMQFGVQQEKIIDYTKMLSEVSMGDGDRFASLSLAFAQINSTGRLMGQDLLQLVNAGFNPLAQISEKTGESMQDLKARMEDGKVSLQEVLGAFRDATSEGGRFYNMNKVASGTFVGHIARIRDAWEQFQISFGTPIMNALKPILEEIASGIGSLMEKAKAAGETIGNAFTLAFVAFKKGRMGELFGASLNFGIALAMDTLFLGLKSAVGFLASALPPIFAALGSKLSDPTFWEGLALYFEGFGKIIGAEIRAALPLPDMARIENDKILAGMLMNSGAVHMGEAAGGINLSEVIQSGLDAGIANAARIISQTGESSRTTETRKALKEITDSLKASADKLKAQTAAATEITGNSKSAPVSSPTAAFNTIAAAVQPAVTSLGRVGGGGGGGFMPVVSEQKRTNSLLTRIEKKLGGNTTPAIA